MSLPFSTLVVLDRSSSMPLYNQVANRLISLIGQGKILPGTFLPATREMALLLKIHRKTVIQAYDELEIQGWIEPVSRKGFRVLLDLPIVKPRSFKPKNHFLLSNATVEEVFSNAEPLLLSERETYTNRSIVVDDGFPDIKLSPFEEFFSQYRTILRENLVRDVMLQNNDGGQLHLRESTSGFLNDTRGLNIMYEHLMITRGAQMAIFIAAALLIKPGDKVIVTEPNYFMADQIFKQRGAELCRIPVDGEGMDVNILESYLKKDKFKLLYIIPHHHHPTTVTMSTSRRIALLNLVKQYDLWVIEDDYDYDFHYRNSPILPLASADHNGKVIYIGSYTKLLGASFRIGYMVAGKQFIRQAMSYRKLMDIRGDFMMEEGLARLIDNGEIGRHIKRSKRIYAERFEIASNLIEKELGHAVDFTRPQGGMAIWLRFKKQYPLAGILNKVKKHELYLKGSAYYKNHKTDLNSIRFGFASLDVNDLKTTVGILQRTLKDF